MFAHIARLGRLKFLQYSPVLYTLGAVVAMVEGTDFKPMLWLHGLVLTWIVHAATHYINEYHDLPADKLNKNPSPWTGGSRVLVEGLLKPQVALVLGYSGMALGVLLTVLLPGPGAWAIGAAILFFAWGYTAPPFKFSWRGLGETNVVLVLNVLVPMLGCLLQLGHLPTLLWAALLPLAIIEFVRMMIMNMADREGDTAAHKHTLVVKLGMPRATRVHRVGLVLAYLSLAGSAALGLSLHAVMWTLLGSAPLAWWIGVRVARWEDWTFDLPLVASIHNVLAAVLMYLALWWQVDAPPAVHVIFGVTVLPFIFGTVKGLMASKDVSSSQGYMLGGLSSAALLAVATVLL